MSNWLGRLSTILKRSQSVDASPGKNGIAVKDQANRLRDAVNAAQVNKNDKNNNHKNKAVLSVVQEPVCRDSVDRDFDRHGTEKQVFKGKSDEILDEKDPMVGPAVTVSSRLDRMIRRKSHTEGNQIKSAPRGYEQVAGLIERIESHMDMQSKRSDRLVTLFESTFAGSDGLNVLSDIKNNNEALVATLKEHLDKQQARDERMSDLLADINRTSDKHVDVLGLIHNQLDTNQQRESEIISTLGDFRSTMSDLTTTNSRSIEVLTRLAQNQQEKQQELSSILQQHYKLIMILAGMCLTFAGGGLVLALVALIRTYAGTG